MSVRLMLGDCLDRMGEIADGSVDMILADLPYGTTACKWDSVIPFEPMWSHFRRVTKPNAAIVLTASQPFTSALVMSNPKAFRYSWVWNKAHASNPLNAKRRPMQRHEDALVFCASGLPRYEPQMIASAPFKSRRGEKVGAIGRLSECYGDRSVQEFITASERYPTTDLYFSSGARAHSLHPTQKPVALMEYLIRTYTHAGETVLDCTMGCGTTGVACVSTGRAFVGIERDPGYFAIAEQRIANAQPQLMAAE